MSEDNPLDGMEGDFDEARIAMEEAAKVLVGFFKAFTSQGLSPQEAAALTAAVMSQGFPSGGIGPSEGS